METKKMIFSGRELPPYIGYGILDEKSVTYENDVIKADYQLECDGSVVHRVTWEKNRCRLESELHGESDCLSNYPDLNKALTYDFLSRNMDKEKIFDFLTRKICDTGNIYVQNFRTAKKEDRRVIFYPAAILMSFRLPILQKNQLYYSFLEYIREDSHISFHKEQSSHLLMMDAGLNVTMHPIIVAEFIVPLAYMTSAARIFVESGLIHPGKLLRLMVDDSCETQSAFMQTFIGDSIHPYFAICFKEMEEDKRPAMMKIFEQTIKGLNERVIK